MKRFKPNPGTAKENSRNTFHDHFLDFTEFTLPNDLHCILYKNNKLPIVNLTIGYNVGSKNEKENKKGIAHLFEHLMFQGSEHVKKNEHFTNIIKSGGTCNAFTMQDATVYFDIIPSHNLDMALWLEADRMNSLDLTEENLANQKSVVIEERKQRFENAPYGSLMANIFGYLFRNSPYDTSVIGEVDDINSFTVKEALEFHGNYYSPGNSVLIITGDIDISRAEESINKYFSHINKINRYKEPEIEIKPVKESENINIYDNVNLPLLCLAYQIPKSGSDEEYSLEYFTEIIANNKSSRLYKKLVYEKQMISSVKAMKLPLKDSGVLFFQAMINPGIDPAEVKKEIEDSINEFSEKGCSDNEFETIKNQLEFQNTAKILKLINISLSSVFSYLYFRDVERLNSEINKYLSVTKKNVTDSVKKYLTGRNKITLNYLPMNFKNKISIVTK